MKSTAGCGNFFSNSGIFAGVHPKERCVWFSSTTKQVVRPKSLTALPLTWRLSLSAVSSTPRIAVDTSSSVTSTRTSSRRAAARTREWKKGPTYVGSLFYVYNVLTYFLYYPIVPAELFIRTCRERQSSLFFKHTFPCALFWLMDTYRPCDWFLLWNRMGMYGGHRDTRTLPLVVCAQSAKNNAPSTQCRKTVARM